MGLLEKLSARMSRKVRNRGRDYHLGGAVSIESASETFIESAVTGEDLYHVFITRQADGIHVSCTCPYMSDRYDSCKHIWATLLTAESEGLLESWAHADANLIPEHPPYEEIIDQYSGHENDPEGDLNYEDLNSYPGRHLPDRTTPDPGSTSPAGSGTRHWKWAMQTVRQVTSGERAGSATQLSGRQIVYIFNADAIRKGGGLVVEIGARALKRDGSWSKPKSVSMGHDSLEQVEDPLDRSILAQLLGAPHGQWAPGYYERASRFRLPAILANELIPVMCGTERCMLRAQRGGELSQVSWDAGIPWQFLVEVQKCPEPPHYRVEGWLFRGEERLPLSEPACLCREGLMLLRRTFVRYEHHGSFAWVVTLRHHGSLMVPAGDARGWLEDVIGAPSLPPLVLPEELRFEEVRCTPKPRLEVRSDRRSWSPWELAAELRFDYEGILVQSAEPGEAAADVANMRRILRDRRSETEAAQQLKAAGFRFNPGYFDARQWRLSASKLGSAVRHLLSRGWQVEADGKTFRRPGSCEINISSGIDWFELRGAMDFEGRPVPFPKILDAVRKGESTVVLDDGTFGWIPEEWLSNYGILAGLGTPQKDCLRFSRSQVGLLDALLATQPEATCDAVFERARDRLRQFRGMAPASPPPTFQGKLRPYQRDGLGWIHFLREFEFGGCLADDMGLGKTVQVLALLEARRQANLASSAPADSPRPSLVVAPKSLVFNWKQEAERFTPGLSVLDHTGSMRSRAGEYLESYDLVLTTYGTLRRDAPFLKDFEFDYLILDEAQAIKNAGTESAKAVRLLRGRHRLALSGTPIENHLGELWSLFEFLNPGMLGSRSVLRLGSGVLRNPDEETRKFLARTLRPFILRRTKEQVAADLPPKQEQTLFCDLEQCQKRLYDELREYYRQSLLLRIADEGISRSKIQILEALLRLRQAACHPGLIDRKRTGEPSAKLDLLLPQISEVLEEGHKILVFSQFTSFLSIVRERLDAQKIRYEYLDGETRDRAAPVEHFQNDPDCGLFLISLRAGGLGLNLTAAEYVYLLDPWWNPAVESQAIDRTHRIGQTRPVFAYRIIARETVEEKVLELQRTKRDLADAIIGADTSLIRDLSREDLELLLS